MQPTAQAKPDGTIAANPLIRLSSSKYRKIIRAE
jgi:hypothetical protein